MLTAVVQFLVAGVVSTFAGRTLSGTSEGVGTAAQFFYPKGLVVDTAGNVYVGDSSNYNIRKITAAGWKVNAMQVSRCR